MEKIRNKIITISGEPASGKSTVVGELRKQYEEMGYNVYVIKTGDPFRIVIMKEYLKLHPEKPNATLADVQADESFAPRRNEIDKLFDEGMRKKGIRINSKERPNNVYIIDSRLAWSNIPESYAIRLTIDEKEAGERSFNDESRGPEDRYPDIETAIEQTRKRKLGEIERYKKRYGVDLADPENYDLIVDTTYSRTEELAQIIMAGEKSYREEKYYPKMWASPACFIGTQSDRQTGAASGMGNCSPDGLAEIMKKDGYNPNLGEIQVLENYGEKFVQDGHHRAMAVLAMGKTLVPYRVNNDPVANKLLAFEQNNIWFAYDWSDCIRYYGGKIGKQKQFENFQIKDLTSYERRLKPMIDEQTRKNQEGR